MCIEGRINRPDLTNSNNQIIICKSHPLSKLLVKECQQKSFHIGRKHNLERVISILPQERLGINEKPFENAEIQFFGPILVKLSNKTQANPAKTKTLWCNFYMHGNTCCSFGNSRWPHKLLVYSVVTQFFLLIGRNVKELNAAVNEIDQEKVMTEIVKRGTYFSWKINPPSSPWMGRAWDLLIKSAKRSLKAIML